MPRTLVKFLAVLSVTFVLSACRPATDAPSKPATDAPSKPSENPPPTMIVDQSAQPTVDPESDAALPVDKPLPPLQLAIPAAMPDQLDGEDLTTMDTEELLGRANQSMQQGNYSRAANFQYWYVQKSKTGQYNLSCFLARIGQTDPAFYWLQIAALEEGVDTAGAQSDGDLASLRRDPRWVQVRRYLQDCNRYFETADIGRTLLILPKGYKLGSPIPVVLWLHGHGSCPEDFIDSGCQEYADNLNVALVGVSGTKARGPNSFVWAEDINQDANQLREALKEISDLVTIKPGHVITFGFSQGAQVGLEIAAKFPEEYAGSIVLSPGARSHLSTIDHSSLLEKRCFVVTCGAKEALGNVVLTSNDAKWLRRAKARVIYKAYPKVSAHAFPSDFSERFPEWVKSILETRGE